MKERGTEKRQKKNKERRQAHMGLKKWIERRRRRRIWF